MRRSNRDQLNRAGAPCACSSAGALVFCGGPGTIKSDSDNVTKHRKVQAFLANTLPRLGGKHVSLLRADSGFGDSAFLDHLEHQQMHDVIALRQNQPANLSGACIAAARTATTESKNSNTISPPTVSICRIFGRPKRRSIQ
jgi:hypothetical protein